MADVAVNGPGAAPRGQLDPEFWRDRRVLLTGHTGFKGAWLSLWLQSLGGRVWGLSNAVPTDPSLYELARIEEGMEGEIVADVRDYGAVERAIGEVRPEVVIHMAAQSLVRQSFAAPRETYETNVMGTVNVLEAIRRCPDVGVGVNVTSDKCYENRGWERGYREEEPMGGHDPYSSSKGASELVTAAYRRSFFGAADGTRIASARAGNVIGGGDWSPDRLIPDIAQAVVDGTPPYIRNPNAVRPWQHVVSPLSGYLLLAQELWSEPTLATGWNFGPVAEDERPVWWVVDQLRVRWPDLPAWQKQPGMHPHEAKYLRLDSSRARARLGWHPLVRLDTALNSIADWYEALWAGADMRMVTLAQIGELVSAAPDLT